MPCRESTFEPDAGKVSQARLVLQLALNSAPDLSREELTDSLVVAFNLLSESMQSLEQRLAVPAQPSQHRQVVRLPRVAK